MTLRTAVYACLVALVGAMAVGSSFVAGFNYGHEEGGKGQFGHPKRDSLKEMRIIINDDEAVFENLPTLDDGFTTLISVRVKSAGDGDGIQVHSFGYLTNGVAYGGSIGGFSVTGWRTNKWTNFYYNPQ